MQTGFFLLVSIVAAVNAQMLNPISAMPMGSAFGNPMWHSGVRYPGVMQTSQLSSMTYPTWRTHPVFRISSSERNYGMNLPSDVTNVPKIPSTQEVLTHMALANQNPKPYLDTISDFLYEPQKTRTVLTPVASVATMTPVASKPYVDAVSEYLNDYQKARSGLTSATPVTSVVSVAPLGSAASAASMTSVSSKPYTDPVSDYLNDYQKARAALTPMTFTGAVAQVPPVVPASPVYLQGMNLMRASANIDDCVQDGARWERGMDWLY